MRKLGFPEAPLVLGIILGPMVDENLRRGFILSGGNIAPFFGSTISIVLAIAVFFTLFGRLKPIKKVMATILRPGTLIFNGIKKRIRKTS